MQEVQGEVGNRQESPSCLSSPACGPQEEELSETQGEEGKAEQVGQHAPESSDGFEQDVGGQSIGQQSTSPCW